MDNRDRHAYVAFVAPLYDDIDTTATFDQIKPLLHGTSLGGQVTEGRWSAFWSGAVVERIDGLFYLGHSSASSGLRLSDGTHVPPEELAARLASKQAHWVFLASCYGVGFVDELQSEYRRSGREIDVFATIDELESRAGQRAAMAFAQMLRQTGDVRRAYQGASPGTPLRFFPGASIPSLGLERLGMGTDVERRVDRHDWRLDRHRERLDEQETRLRELEEKTGTITLRLQEPAASPSAERMVSARDLLLVIAIVVMAVLVITWLNGVL